MLTVAFSLFLAFYVLGPDLIFRWLVAFFAPARTRKRNYGEQIAVACVLSVVPFLISWELTRAIFNVYSPEHKHFLESFLNGILAQATFEQHSRDFYAALPFIWKINGFAVFVVYAIVALAGWGMGRLIKRVGRVTRKLDGYPRLAKAVNLLVRPWTAEWHLRLSNMLLPTDTSFIQVEVLTTMDVLHRGTLARHDLNGDGVLVSITLEKAERFRRQAFMRQRDLIKSRQPAPKPEDFWTQVPGDFYIIRAEQIATLNIRYVDPGEAPPSLSALPVALESIKQFLQDFERMQALKSEGPMPFGQPPKRRKPNSTKLSPAKDIETSAKQISQSRRRHI